MVAEEEDEDDSCFSDGGVRDGEGLILTHSQVQTEGRSWAGLITSGGLGWMAASPDGSAVWNKLLDVRSTQLFWVKLSATCAVFLGLGCRRNDENQFDFFTSATAAFAEENILSLFFSSRKQTLNKNIYLFIFGTIFICTLTVYHSTLHSVRLFTIALSSLFNSRPKSSSSAISGRRRWTFRRRWESSSSESLLS